MRLDRFLADAGIGTRNEVKKIIRSGRITADDKTVTKPETHIDCEKSIVCIDGQKIEYRKFIYLILNKPQGYISATWDKRLPTVVDLLPAEYRHFEPFPVGRLDIDTEGLLILTNDGALSHRLLSPKKHVPKKYFMHTEKPFTDSDIAAFGSGLTLDDGFHTLPAELSVLSLSEPYSAQVTIFEGKFHQVKRMAEAVGNRVTYLQRIEMNGLCLDSELQLGEMRELTAAELVLLDPNGTEEKQ